MLDGLPKDLLEYIRLKPQLNNKQKMILAELSEEYSDLSQSPEEYTAKYVRRCLKSGWRNGC